MSKLRMLFKNKYFLIFVVIITLFLFFSFDQDGPSVSFFRKGGGDVGDLFVTPKRLFVTTQPKEAKITFENRLLGISPAEISLTGEMENITITKTGYMEVSVSTKTTFPSLSVDLLTSPELINAYTGRLYTSPNIIDVKDSSKNALVFLNPRSFQLEGYFSGNYFTILPASLKDVTGVFWSDSAKAVVTAGLLAEDKVTYLVDFSDWSSVSPPSLTTLPFIGDTYVWSPAGDSLLFLDEINYGDSTSVVKIYSLVEGKFLLTDSRRMDSPSKLFWDTESSYFYFSPSVEDLSQVQLYDSSNDSFGTLFQYKGGVRKPLVENIFDNLAVLDSEVLYISAEGLGVFDVSSLTHTGLSEKGFAALGFSPKGNMVAVDSFNLYVFEMGDLLIGPIKHILPLSLESGEVPIDFSFGKDSVLIPLSRGSIREYLVDF